MTRWNEPPDKGDWLIGLMIFVPTLSMILIFVTIWLRS